MTEELDHNEAQLMQALAMQDDAVSKDFKAYAGEPKPTDEKIASKEDIIEALKTVLCMCRNCCVWVQILMFMGMRRQLCAG